MCNANELFDPNAADFEGDTMERMTMSILLVWQHDVAKKVKQ
jgi:hypothetical protein